MIQSTPLGCVYNLTNLLRRTELKYRRKKPQFNHEPYHSGIYENGRNSTETGFASSNTLTPPLE